MAPPAPEQSQKQYATTSISPTAALGPGGIIASTMGGRPFVPSPDAPSPNEPSQVLPATHVSIPNVSPQKAPAAKLEGGQSSPSTYAI